MFPGYFLSVDGPGRAAILEAIGHRAFGFTQLCVQFIVRVVVRYFFDFHNTLFQKEIGHIYCAIGLISFHAEVWKQLPSKSSFTFQ